MRTAPAVAAGIALVLGLPSSSSAAVGAAPEAFPQRPGAPRDTVPTLGLESGRLRFHAGGLTLELVRASQTAAALRPDGADEEGGGDFDFTPGDRLGQRAADGFFHLGDLTLRLRRAGPASDAGDSGQAATNRTTSSTSDTTAPWRSYSTAEARAPVAPLDVDAPVLAAADLAPTLPEDIPLRVRRYWEVRDGHLTLRFELSNRSQAAVEVGGLGIPMIFDNILSDRSLEEAHAVASFHDPYIGMDAGYLQVTRLNGHGPALVVVPDGDTPFEAWRPLLSDPTRRGVTFEGFYAWTVLSRAWAENEWKGAQPWNPPGSVTLAPGETRSWGVRFLVAPEIRAIESTLAAAGRPVAVGVPGYVVPTDQDARLFLRYGEDVRSMDVEPAGALAVTATGTTPGGWKAWDVRGRTWGRVRLTVTYRDGLRQTIQYKVVDPADTVVARLGRFATTKQWFERPDDPFGRSPSVITYDNEAQRQVTEDDRVWIAGLGDEGGASWLPLVMKQLVRPDPGEVARLQRFVDGVVWGGLQYAEGDRAYGVRKSLFYWAPDSLPAGTYSDSVRYGGWSSWDREQAESVGRSYDYPHVAALYWVLYRLARNHPGLVTDHPWDWYLDHAFETGRAMVRYAPHYAQFGQMEGTVFVFILRDLQREGWSERADALEEIMRARAQVWRSLAYPFGSEMPWDSTGQEEVYAWCRYFGYDAKAEVTLNAILGYMPTVPHWGYNGSARRYWDFMYAGKLRRLERQLHHYGSALNAIPVLAEFRSHPDDLYLLRVGYAGMMGGIANVTRDGFGPSGFHAYPSTLRIDGYTGDYGPGFFGHAMNTGTYVVDDPELGWLAFGGDLRREGDTVRVAPRDDARTRVYLASLGLWLTLDAGTFREVTFADGTVTIALSPADAYTPEARLRVEQPARVEGVGRFRPDGQLAVERGAYVVPLGADGARIVLRSLP